MDPETSEFSPDGDAYSPAMLTVFDFVWQFHGVRPSGDGIEWNCRSLEGAGSTTSKWGTAWGTAELQIDHTGSTLPLAGKQIAKFRGKVRLVTTNDGKLVRLIATEPER
jgi:hypothetical protein